LQLRLLYLGSIGFVSFSITYVGINEIEEVKQTATNNTKNASLQFFVFKEILVQKFKILINILANELFGLLQSLSGRMGIQKL
jgi:hypothetical protein